MSASKTIAIITGSTRPVRVGPNVADFVQNIIEAKADLGDYKIVPVRLADFNLPVLNETQMPGMIFKPEDYEHEHSRRWSTEIQKHARISWRRAQRPILHVATRGWHLFMR